MTDYHAGAPTGLLLFGASGFAREVSSWARDASWQGRTFNLLGFIDDVEPNRTVHELPVWTLEDAARLHPGARVAGAVGDPALRGRLMAAAQNAGLPAAPPLIHPNVEYDRLRVTIGHGTIICPGSVLTTEIEVGRHVQINMSCTFGHDVRVEDFATFGPGVHISGKVDIGRGAYFGTGAVTVDGEYDRHLQVGAGAVIGAGAVVTGDIAAGVTAVGVPARPRP